ncbi:MAG TPA: peptidoglycan DD-metalloendopeptidase family protein [Pyrinomonadaceae bacterium]|nr:peptidoglycan DD-metalloendopeptidase family protein [Pyrinomonadaceae bacterium]
MNKERHTTGEEAEAANADSRVGPEEVTKERAISARVRSSSPARLRLQILLGFAAVVTAVAALVWWLSLKPKSNQIVVTSTATESPAVVPPIAEPTLQVPSPQPGTEPSVEPPETSQAGQMTQPTPSPEPSTAPPVVSPSNAASLLIPVAGVRVDQLLDTFQAARAEGRVHDAIDIPAPRGTPVLAATDGRIVKLFQSVPGGTTIYQLGTDDKTVYYYAHLDRYADGLREDSIVRRGEVIAYVGDTGNAGAGNYHLHFSISIVSDPKRYWQGTNINPYPLLRGMQK